RASPSTWSNGEGRPARDGGPSCITTRRTLPPWTCSLFRPSVSTCSMLSSSSGSVAEILSGSMSQHIRPPIGLRDKSRKHSPERGSALHDPSPRSDLRHHRHTPTARDGHPGQSYRTGLTLAEWRCRTADRLDPARERRSYDRAGRGASASHPEILRPLLQRSQNASVFEQGCARLSLGTAHRCHSFTRHPWRTSPPLRTNLSFRYTQGSNPCGLCRNRWKHQRNCTASRCLEKYYLSSAWTKKPR